MADLRILTTGGTIDKIYFDDLSSYQVGDPQISDLLTEANVTLAWTVQALLRKDSLEIDAADRRQIRDAVLAAPERHLLVTHGTDTMADTAAAIGDPDGRTVVLTGAMQPARFQHSDAVFNIGFALATAMLQPAGAWIAMNGRVFAAGAVRKNRAENRFEAVG